MGMAFAVCVRATLNVTARLRARERAAGMPGEGWKPQAEEACSAFPPLADMLQAGCHRRRDNKGLPDRVRAATLHEGLPDRVRAATLHDPVYVRGRRGSGRGGAPPAGDLP